jgi:hypothetical protein
MKLTVKELVTRHGASWDMNFLDENHHNVNNMFLGYMVLDIYDISINKAKPEICLKFTHERNDYILILT